VITSVEAGATHGMATGDRVLTINGRPAAAALAEIESLTSAATPQWRRLRALAELAGGQPGGTATLTVQPHAGGPVRTVTVAYTAPFGSSLGIGGFGSPTDPRPEQIAELRPGIFYVDLTRISDDDFNAAVDQLAAADGVVFDMRGYPFSLFSDSVLRHLIDKPVTSSWFNIPIVTRPDRQGWRWDSRYDFLTPLAPRLAGRIDAVGSIAEEQKADVARSFVTLHPCDDPQSPVDLAIIRLLDLSRECASRWGRAAVTT
jgi:hypothetical protein